jgi:hypothetical protein
MLQTSNHNNAMQTPNCFVWEDRDGNPHLVTCSTLRGYPTVSAAKEAEIKEIKEKRRFHLETVSGLLNDIKGTREQQSRASVYCEINAFMDEIEKAGREEEKIRGLRLEDGSL